jgi:hypothetical protein
MDAFRLSVATAESLAPTGEGDILVERVSELARGQGASAELSAEWLLLASTIVHVCSIVFETARSALSFSELERARKLEKVLISLAEKTGSLAEKTGDPTVSANPEVVKVAERALEILEADTPRAGK